MFCDRCPARALTYISKTVQPGKTLRLSLCGHHVRGNYPRLAADGWDIEVVEDALGYLPEELAAKVSKTEKVSSPVAS